MQHLLVEIDNNISREAEKLERLAQEMEFKEIMVFNLGDASLKVPEELFAKKGLYFFELKNNHPDILPSTWHTNFESIWKNEEVTWYPGLKKRRLYAHEKFNTWIPFYIGKSLTVGGRIHEHIYQPPHKTTFSMKLNARTNLIGEVFKVSWIELDVINYHMIAPTLELHLRNRLNPVIGKQ